MIRRSPLIALVVLTAILAACSSSGGQSSTTPPGQAVPGLSDLSTEPPALVIRGPGADDLSVNPQALAAGDFNGDGAADLLIGAPFGDGPEDGRQDAGEAYVLTGPFPDSGDLELPGDAALTITGARPGDNLGFTVLAADLNGDGTDDLVVGAPGVTAGRDPRTDQGRVYVFFGKAGLSGSFDLAPGGANPDFVVTGAEGFSRVGHALAAGDVNGDGTADLVLGAPFAGREPGTPPGSARKEAGEVYAVFGSPELRGELNIAFDEPDFTASAEQHLGHFGAAVAAGDINGDGVDDVIAGSPQATVQGRGGAGAVYAFFGGDRLGGRRFIDRGQYDVRVSGAETGDGLGLPLAAADIDGDGADDLLAGAHTADGPGGSRPAAGEAYILSGGRLPNEIDAAGINRLIYAAGDSGLFPTTAVAIGSGSGATLLLSSALGPRERPGAGALYYVPLAPDAAAIDLAQPEGRAGLLGAAGGDRLGSAVALLPDEGAAGSRIAVMASGAGVIYLLAAP